MPACYACCACACRRRDRPFGFVAKPENNKDGSVDLTEWNCTVPGKEGTPWEGGHYPVTLKFGNDYPAQPPIAMFPAGFFHVNVYESGAVCLSILNADEDLGGQWKPSISVKQILMGIQELLSEPNEHSAAQAEAEKIYRTNRRDYDRRVRQQAQKFAAKEDD